ncbi:MAG: trimethylamine methyltransferase family protein [Anaerolineae bacterium]
MGSGGLTGGQYRPLTPESVGRIHQVALDILWEVGTQVNSAEAFEIFAEAGATVDRDTRVVRIPRSMVEDAIASAPSRVVLAGRDERHDLILEGNRVYLGTGGTTIYVLDLEGNKRKSTTQDVADIARLVDALDNVHFIVIPVYPNELPVEQVDVNRFYASLANSSKHVQGGVYTLEGVRQVIRMGEIIAGGPDALRERSILSFIICLISPLKMDAHYTDMMLEIVRHGLPVSISVEPLSGATAPITLAGHLAQWAAEALSGVTLVQLTRKGSPCLPGYVGTITDLRNMGYLSGAVEQGLLNAGVAQLAHYWNLPCYATSGMSDSKALDVQTGYEGAMTTLMAVLSGANFIHDAAGLMEFAMVASYEKYVIDNEVIGMAMRAVRGIEVSTETLAQEVITAVGPGGNFLAEDHTARHLRSEFYFPTLSDRESREDWMAAGAKTARDRAREKVRQILQAHQPARWPDDVEKRIRGEIAGIAL